MKSFVPVSGLIVYAMILYLEKLQIIPDPLQMLETVTALYEQYSFFLLFLVILIESIVYVGFYFPGQLFAVLIVLTNDFTWFNVIMLTVVSILAVTISAAINYKLGTLAKRSIETNPKRFQVRGMLIAMLHINLLALYMFQLGSSGSKRKAIFYAGLLNLPYYLLLIAGTFAIRDQIPIITEDSYFLLILIILWALIAIIMDVRDYLKKNPGIWQTL